MWTSDFEPFSFDPREGVTLAEALEMLTDYLPYFERPGFKLGRWVEPVEGPDDYVRLTERGERFVRDLHSHRWIREYTRDDSPRTRKLDNEDDLHAFDDATPEELSQLLTGCLLLDQIHEGTLLNCCESGWLTRILQRAVVLQGELSPEEGAKPMP